MKFARMKMRPTSYYLEWAARIHVFVLLNIYGSGKILGGQFYRRGALPDDVASIPLSEASAYDLGWTFMGYSQEYILFIGISQIVGAWCLLWNKTKFIGIAVLFPILVNIIVFDIIFLDQKGALFSACLYLGLLILILILNKETVTKTLQLITDTDRKFESRSISDIGHLGVAVIIFGGVFTIEQLLVRLIGH